MQVRSILAGFCLAMAVPFTLLGQTSIDSDTLRGKNFEGSDNGSAAAMAFNVVTTKYFDLKLTRSVMSSLYVEKASFIKLDNFSLAYSLPVKIPLSVNFTVQNLFTLSSYTGLDPEVAHGEMEQKGNTKLVIDKSPFVSGSDHQSDYAPARIFSIGASVLF